MTDYTMNKASENKDFDLDKILEAIKQLDEHIYNATEIFMGDPFDLIGIDMSEIPRNCYFISHYGMEKGKLYKVEDGELKRELYAFIEKHPDRVFRGRK